MKEFLKKIMLICALPLILSGTLLIAHNGDKVSGFGVIIFVFALWTAEFIYLIMAAIFGVVYDIKNKIISKEQKVPRTFLRLSTLIACAFIVMVLTWHLYGGGIPVPVSPYALFIGAVISEIILNLRDAKNLAGFE